MRGRHVPALEMTKWFDTNYHYLVPSLGPGQRFHLASTKPLDEFREAADVGVRTRPVVLGPVSFLLLSKGTGGSPLGLLPGLVPVYEDLLGRLDAAGAEWVQLDEPVLATDLDGDARGAFGPAYARLRRAAPGLRLLVATYFSGLRANLELALGLPVDALHLDLVAEPDQLEPALEGAPPSLALSLGVVDGRNVWRADLDATLAILEHATGCLGSDRVMVAPSCSLLHVPLDLDAEEGLDRRLRSWLAFATQKVDEVVVLATALREGRRAVVDALQAARVAARSRQRSPLVHDEAVARRLAAVTAAMHERASPSPERRARQAAVLPCPSCPPPPSDRSPRPPRSAGPGPPTAEESSTGPATSASCGPRWRRPSVSRRSSASTSSSTASSSERLWVNPDCGLKTRRWEEALPSLKRMVEAARLVRAEVADR